MNAVRWTLRALLIAAAAVLWAAAPGGAHVVAVSALALALVLEWWLGRLSPAQAGGAALGASLGTWTGDWLALALFPDLERLQPFVVLVGAFAGTVAGLRAASLVGDRPLRSESPGSALLLDTSALIDGRIVAVLESGLAPGRVVIPEFVIAELQAVADSADPHVRARGRRGLETLERLRSIPTLEIRLTDEDVPQTEAVDDKLVRLARLHGHRLVTLDFNLAKVAAVHDVRTVNLNDVALALRRPATPGEDARLAVVRAGREPGQGIAYLDDGTMVVIENAAQTVGSVVDVVITGSLPTAGGTMLFARLKGDPSAHNG